MPSPRSEWVRARNAENNYAAQLRKVARHVADIVLGFDPIDEYERIRHVLELYSQALEPWAESAGRRMVAEVAARNRRSWFEASRSISRNLHTEIDRTPIGAVSRNLVDNQVGLITSMPRDAATRVQKLALQAFASGQRPASLVDEIRRTGQVTRSRAELIAKTETSRAMTSITQSRAEFVGSTHYIWRTMKDNRVREDHRDLEGQAFPWGLPPVADTRSGARAHPGCIYNCRCFAEPIIPDISV